MKHKIRVLLTALLVLLNTVLPVSAVNTPATGDAGMTTVIILVCVGAALIAAFLVLSAVQKKRRQHNDSDD